MLHALLLPVFQGPDLVKLISLFTQEKEMGLMNIRPLPATIIPGTFCFWAAVRSRAEEVMAPHSSTLAWKIPWTEEPGRLQSMGSRRVGHDCATSLSLFTFLHWRRKWQPTPVFLPGESQGQRSLVGFCLWGHTELDMTEST